ncbi:hypothetical protein [Kistimonas asteriae]|uniref:hypothetical protein n=1 Tax=Kistimonas asteriae TaxID=517724 RepID=UPI001BA75939|nr:hypothetical protein [Kistimonas asteriae]
MITDKQFEAALETVQVSLYEKAETQKAKEWYSPGKTLWQQHVGATDKMSKAFHQHVKEQYSAEEATEYQKKYEEFLGHHANGNYTD